MKINNVRESIFVPKSACTNLDGFNPAVLLRLFWIKRQTTAEEEDSGSEVFKFPVSSTARFDFLDFSIHTFSDGIVRKAKKHVADCVILCLDAGFNGEQIYCSLEKNGYTIFRGYTGELCQTLDAVIPSS